jgi:translation initiation factor 1 (eIF-1/SUI1)
VWASSVANDPESLPRKNPFEALRDKLGALPDGPERTVAPRPRPAPAIQERVTVRRERAGRGGKTVTIAAGPGLAGRDLSALAQAASQALGLGARAEHGALVLQGDQCERLVTWLGARGFARVERGN